MEEDMMDTQLQNKLTWLYKYCRYYEADCEHKNDCLLIDDCPHQKARNNYEAEQINYKRGNYEE